MKIIVVFLFGLVPMVVPATAFAYPSLSDFRSWNNDSQTIYLRGLYDGFLWANADIEVRDQPPLFCAPRRLAITPGQLGSIVDRYSADNPDMAKDDDEYGVVALMALKDVFPCGVHPTDEAIAEAVAAATAAADAIGAPKE